MLPDPADLGLYCLLRPVCLYTKSKHQKLTLRNILQTNVCNTDIGAQQKTYRTRKGSGMCSIIFARNLKSSILHMK